jgi:hypothetical protein
MDGLHKRLELKEQFCDPKYMYQMKSKLDSHENRSRSLCSVNSLLIFAMASPVWGRNVVEHRRYAQVRITGLAELDFEAKVLEDEPLILTGWAPLLPLDKRDQRVGKRIAAKRVCVKV